MTRDRLKEIFRKNKKVARKLIDFLYDNDFDSHDVIATLKNSDKIEIRSFDMNELKKKIKKIPRKINGAIISVKVGENFILEKASEIIETISKHVDGNSNILWMSKK